LLVLFASLLEQQLRLLCVRAERPLVFPCLRVSATVGLECAIGVPLNTPLFACLPLQNFGVDVNTGGVVDTFNAFVWEPSLVKYNAIQSATEAACLILRYPSH